MMKRTGGLYCGYCNHSWDEITKECPKCGLSTYVHWNPDWEAKK